MAVSPAEQTLSATPFGGRVLCGSLRSGVASYDGFGLRFVYVPPETCEAKRYHYAIDVEALGVPCPDVVAAALGCSNDSDEALRHWTELEVTAKLTDTPVLLLLQAQDRHFAIDFQRCDTLDHLIVVGRRKCTAKKKKENFYE